MEFHSLIYADTFFNAGSLSGYHRNVNHRVAFYQRSRAWTSTIPKSLLPLKPECFYTIIEPKLKYSKVKFLAFFNSGNHGLELKFFWYTAVQLYISNINLLASWVSESKSDIFNCFCFVVVSLITRTLSRQLSWKSQIGQPALYASVKRCTILLAGLVPLWSCVTRPDQPGQFGTCRVCYRNTPDQSGSSMRKNILIGLVCIRWFWSTGSFLHYSPPGFMPGPVYKEDWWTCTVLHC